VAGDLLRASDVATVREQIGREPTTSFVVYARCTGGHPLVIRNAPHDADGTPFPTTYWLTCPEAVRAVSRVESEGWISALNDRAERDWAFSEAIGSAHRSYMKDRGTPDGGVGGTRGGIKCLHAHFAYHLAGGEDPVGVWVAERVEPVHREQRPGRVAVIDQGTNSIRLLVMEPAAKAPTELARDMVITRLGRDVDRTGRLDPASLARTIEVLARFCRRARALGAERIRVGATAAVRDASNRDEVERAVRAHAGSDLEVLSGEREAELSFLGGTRGLDRADGPFLVVDIGGGSTEFVVGTEPGVADRAVSVQMGSVRMTERFVSSDPPTAVELQGIERAVGSLLDEVETKVPVREAKILVAVAGTATTTQACALGLDVYDPDRIHRSWLSIADAERTLEQFASMTNAECAAIAVMPPGRGDVITAGAEILVTLMRRFGFERALVSETDILDGLAFELLGVR
jgi:exopolyphosphatase/guanosine-5'-triphosphate,3'-diphosphate pyrophosphatase